MERVRAEMFAGWSEAFGAIMAITELSETALEAAGAQSDALLKKALPQDMVRDLRPQFRQMERELLKLEGLQVSSMTAKRIQDLLRQPDPSWGGLNSLINELRGRFKDELSAMFLFSLTPSEADRYSNPLKGWSEVADKFPSSNVDIEEAAKCLSLNRSTAGVFHLMRVMEIGLRVLGAALKNPDLDPKTNPTWERILRKCDAELQKPRHERSPEWAADDLFFAEATANLRAVKDAWRNPTMHVEIVYDGERALDVWNSVRAFMRHLATKLTE